MIFRRWFGRFGKMVDHTILYFFAYFFFRAYVRCSLVLPSRIWFVILRSVINGSFLAVFSILSSSLSSSAIDFDFFSMLLTTSSSIFLYVGTVYHTPKDHKPNFGSNPKCRLINPTKTEIGKISKQILERINKRVTKEITPTYGEAQTK